MTNVLELLHTTAAYQSAAMQLMVNEANFAAQAVGIKEVVPPVAQANTNEWTVEPPPRGVSGFVASDNYGFCFLRGKLFSISKRDWLHNISPPITDLLELAERPSLLDTNGAYLLARQWLADLSLDVGELEREFPPRIFQVPARRKDATGKPLAGVSNNVAVPLFQIGWGPGFGSRLARPSDVFIEILGTTKELIALEITRPDASKRPALKVENAPELLGPAPSPRHFVEELLGGRSAYEAISAPDTVEAWLLTSSHAGEEFREKKDRSGPVKLGPKAVTAFSDVFLDFDSYRWSRARGVRKSCIIDYGARLRFTRGTDVVDIHLCYECDVLEVAFKGRARQEDFDDAHDALVKALQAVFPGDGVVRTLKLRGRN